MARTHVLDCEAQWFEDVREGRKRFEVCLDDRVYALGDVLRLREYDANGRSEHTYTGREHSVRVAAVWYDVPGVDPHYLVLSIGTVEPPATLESLDTTDARSLLLEALLRRARQYIRRIDLAAVSGIDLGRDIDKALAPTAEVRRGR